jgi:hypothetical protein
LLAQEAENGGRLIRDEVPGLGEQNYRRVRHGFFQSSFGLVGRPQTARNE